MGLVLFLAFIAEALVEHFREATGEGASASGSLVADLRGPGGRRAVVLVLCTEPVRAAADLLPVVGMVLSALLVGGGSPLIHVVVNKARAPVYPQVGL